MTGEIELASKNIVRTNIGENIGGTWEDGHGRTCNASPAQSLGDRTKSIMTRQIDDPHTTHHRLSRSVFESTSEAANYFAASKHQHGRCGTPGGDNAASHVRYFLSGILHQPSRAETLTLGVNDRERNLLKKISNGCVGDICGQEMSPRRARCIYDLCRSPYIIIWEASRDELTKDQHALRSPAITLSEGTKRGMLFEIRHAHRRVPFFGRGSITGDTLGRLSESEAKVSSVDPLALRVGVINRAASAWGLEGRSGEGRWSFPRDMIIAAVLVTETFFPFSGIRRFGVS